VRNVVLLAATGIGIAAAPATARSSANRAVLLVSGVESTSPFSTPAASCAGKEGPAWGIHDGVAPALKAAGFSVYTAPVRDGPLKSPPPSCAKRAPSSSTWLNSKGDIDANGAALNRLLAFLYRTYHVDTVTLVGHSDGGLWSRAAIATHESKPTIDGLVTLGTPYTGSFVADIGSLLTNLACGGADPTCVLAQNVARGLVTLLGPSAIEELSSSFLATWNPQVQIGRCRVTAIQGTAIRPAALPPSQPRLSDYYAPSDGLVGKSSAANQASWALDGTRIPATSIPGLVNGGAFFAYHVPGLGNPSELNDPAINAAIVRAVHRQSTACAGKLTRARTGKLVLRFRTASGVGLRGGSLGAAGRGDIALATKNAKVVCGRTALTASPLLPVSALETVVAGSCNRLSAGSAALLLHAIGSSAELTLTGKALTVKVSGPPIHKLTVAVRRGARWTTIPLKRGHGTVPSGDRVDLRITGRTRAGAGVTASALMAN
jgi:pimeloyl-ACP methyl ester carboxylesterase